MKIDTVNIEEYSEGLINKDKLENGSISIDDLSLEELENVQSVYAAEIMTLAKENDELRKRYIKLKTLYNKQ